MSIGKGLSGARDLLGVLIFLIVLLLLLAFLAPFSSINCRKEEVDIRSGRTRYTRLFFWWPLSQRIEASPVSEVLGASGDEAQWCPLNTFSPASASQSPQHSYPGAFAQMQAFAAMWNLGEFTPDARRGSALQLLELWQRGRGYRSAGHYLGALATLTTERANEHPQKPIEMSDLPQTSAGQSDGRGW
jgi:hypothetical protein